MAGGRPRCNGPGVLSTERPPPAANLQQLLRLLRRPVHRERLHFSLQEINPARPPVFLLFSFFFLFWALVEQRFDFPRTRLVTVWRPMNWPRGSVPGREPLCCLLLRRRQRDGLNRGALVLSLGGIGTYLVQSDSGEAKCVL